jgi:hypothetical protein
VAELRSEPNTSDQSAEHGPRSGEAGSRALPELGGESIMCCLLESLLSAILEMNLKIERALHVSRFPIVALQSETNHDQGDSAQYRNKSVRHKRFECGRQIGPLSRAGKYLAWHLLDRERKNAKRDQ